MWQGWMTSLYIKRLTVGDASVTKASLYIVMEIMGKGYSDGLTRM